ncbi:ArsR/SmtB family transcription factor [Nonomuraea zeae]|uniref:Helix-turn-helix transcriptional regulator n=1 Tax=Nonomuraea zeae TaxID=1642303 RepID=A0A5S4GK27_9ACTN|nr:helix-turn-helix domain-containing protein [Nonomuraea zeae]TMR33296.1 helix-turn-helix transcriptional regulator [Nonomuraea zeae]
MSLESSEGRPRRVLDAAAMRAFAHPVRLALHELLMRAGPTTAADAAREVGVSQALASYHLRQLAKYGLVTQAEPRDERERPWKASESRQDWGDTAGPEGTAARSLLEQVMAERALARLVEWQERRGDEPEPWQAAGGLSNSYVYATAEEFQALGEAIAGLLEPLIARIDDPATRPGGARPVLLTQLWVPLAPTASGD